MIISINQSEASDHVIQQTLQLPSKVIISSKAIMGLTVDVKSNGRVLLTRYNKNQQIFLSCENMFQLVVIYFIR